MESIINTFHIDWKIIIAQAVNFLIVFLVLYFFALKPLNKLMAERGEKIARGVNDAKTNSELLAATKAEYDAALAKARAEAATIFQEGRKKSEVKRAEMLEEAKKDVERLIMNGKKTLEAEKTKMVDEARKEIVSLATAAAEKILKKHGDKVSGSESAKEIESLN
ncbi:MAG: ATP synthase subunit b [Parcubacteria group bacterium GW2011_GWA2_47_16]|nr:MAG: ATP synthase subunit b [Parcubacteria group bacterium GW2011_GWA2_47_16]